MKLALRQECGEEILKKAHELAVCVDNALLDEQAAKQYADYLDRTNGTPNNDDKFDLWYDREGQYFDENITLLMSLLKLLDWIQENVK